MMTSAGSSGRIWALTAAMAGASLAAHVLLLPEGAVVAPPMPWLIPALAGLFAVAEVAVVHVRFRRHAHSWSMSEAPLAIGLVFLSPAALIAARLVGSAVALAVHRRQTPLKLTFNLVVFWLETIVAVVVFRLLVGAADPFGPRGWLAVLAAAALGEFLVSAVAVPAAISLAEGRLQLHVFRWVFLASLIATVANTSLGLLAADVLVRRPWAILLVGIVGVVMYAGYRGYALWRMRHDSLEGLHGLARLDMGSRFEEGLRRVLADVREHLQADMAGLALPPEDPSADVATTLWLDDEPESDPAAALAAYARTALGDRDIVRLPAGGTTTDPGGAPADGRRAVGSDGPGLLAALGARDAMVAVLPGSDGAAGTLVVANRSGSVRAFGRRDEYQFRNLAAYAAVALDNLRLVGRLRHEAAQRRYEALHDALTGLPNRGLLTQRLESAIAACPPGEKVGLLLLDLDGFKEVNDTLGHHVGDLLLQRVADRLRGALRPGDIVARIGGDEFTVMLPTTHSADQLVAGAERICETLARPFRVGAMALEVGASIGIAWFPDHGTTPTELLQRADVAMYSAKLRRSVIEAYDPARDPRSSRRLELLGQLRSAMDSDDFFVSYQPMVDLGTGRVVGAEALARWHHPAHGPVSPEEFVPLAEHGGLIRPLTDRVLRSALAECRRWREAGLDLHVAVNLSVRTLLDTELPRHIRGLLDEAGVPPDSLRLEITESCMVVDPVLTTQVLDELAGVGVALSIDDFGTGYSSLTSLRGLPIDEIKIDRSFVATMASDRHDAVIVRLAVELGQNLGLRVVAEGVEDADTSRRLAAIGCHYAQGHLYGRAMSGPDLQSLLGRPDRERARPAAG